MQQAESVEWFSKAEEELLSKRDYLDEIDRKILIIKLTRPRISNQDIGTELGITRVQVWRRLSKGPLGRLWLEMQKEAISAAQDSVIANALDAVSTLGNLARGECDCPEQVRQGHERDGTPHRLLCLMPVPYAVRRAAAKDLVDILRSKGLVDPDAEGEEEVWEAAINEVGAVRVRKAIATSDGSGVQSS